MSESFRQFLHARWSVGIQKRQRYLVAAAVPRPTPYRMRSGGSRIALMCSRMKCFRARTGYGLAVALPMSVRWPIAPPWSEYSLPLHVYLSEALPLQGNSARHFRANDTPEDVLISLMEFLESFVHKN